MNFWESLFNLRSGEEDKAKVLSNIRGSISFKGSNFWILACAILIASVGLNVNSTAVIIGAMLISPLMGPIVGAGFALGMYDFPLLKRSLINLFIATLVGLIVSAVYFWLTPFKEAQSELLARTSPNIYDVLIAFFGGLVGVIAVTRVEKGNPIPGVAIATALMPPLCTAGYGLATLKWAYFGGAMFLYAINCVFICIATFIIIKFLKYPEAKIVHTKDARRVQWAVWLITILMILPSVYFAYRFYQQAHFKKTVQLFLKKEFEEKGNIIVYQKTRFNSNPRKIELAFLMRRFSVNEIAEINKKLPSYRLNNTHLSIRQDSAFLSEATSGNNPDNEIMSSTNKAIMDLKKELEQYKVNTAGFETEAKVIFPNITSLILAKPQSINAADTLNYLIAHYSVNKPLPSVEQEKLYEWLKVKTGSDSMVMIKR